MKYIILCEGSTDGILIQYFMRNVHLWRDIPKQQKLFGNHTSWYRRLQKDDDLLDIVSCDGSSRLLSFLEYLFDFNKTANISEIYNKAVIITDRDENDTENVFIEAVKQVTTRNNINMLNQLENNKWIKCSYESKTSRLRSMEFLTLIIPFEKNGAMETFLLNSISKKDSYDAAIIAQTPMPRDA